MVKKTPSVDLLKNSTPKFGGSQSSAKQNFLSHKWFRPNENEPNYCAVCDIRDYHEGRFYPCCFVQPENGFLDFTEKDFDNLKWDEAMRQQMQGVAYKVFPKEKFVFAEYTEEDAAEAVLRWYSSNSFKEENYKLKEFKLSDKDLTNLAQKTSNPKKNYEILERDLSFEFEQLKLVPFRGSLKKAVDNFLSHMWSGNDISEKGVQCLVCGTNVITLRRLYPCCFLESKGYENFSQLMFDNISVNKDKLKHLTEKIDKKNIQLINYSREEIYGSLSKFYSEKGLYINHLSRKKLQRNEPCPCGTNLKYKKCHGI